MKFVSDEVSFNAMQVKEFVLTRADGIIRTRSVGKHIAFGRMAGCKMASNGTHWKIARHQLVMVNAVLSTIVPYTQLRKTLLGERRR